MASLRYINAMRRIAALAVLASSVCAQAFDQTDVLVNKYIADARVPGLAFAIIKDGKVVRTGAYGLADIENDAKVKPNSVFEIGSVTKQFTAALIMQLKEQGKLSLSDPISKFLPDVQDSWKNLTIQQLLNHTSGLPDYLSPLLGFSMRKDYKTTELMAILDKKPLDFQPGSSWMYSNTGYYLMGMIIEKLTGKDYKDVLSEQIFKPLAMNDSDYLQVWKVYKNRAFGYQPATKEYRVPETLRPSAAYSAGAIVSTAPDMAKWVIALTSGKVVKLESLKEMWEMGSLNGGRTYPYGAGWFIGEVSGHRNIHHGGNTYGCSAEVSIFPDDNVSVVILSNGAGRSFNELSIILAAKYIPNLKPDTYKPAEKDPNRDRTMRMFEAMRSLLNSKKDPELMDAELLGLLSTQRGTMAASGLRGSVGQIKSLRFVRERKQGIDDLVTYEIIFEKATLPMNLTVTREGKLARFDVPE